MLGKLQGVFSVVGASILSIFHSTDGTYQGTEHLALIDQNSCRACAMLLFNDRKLSSWQVELSPSSAAPKVAPHRRRAAVLGECGAKSIDLARQAPRARW